MAPFPVKELDFEWGFCLSEQEKASLKQGFAEACRGEGMEANALLNEVRFRYSDEQLAQIKAGCEDMKNGNCIDAFEGIEMIRAKYGL